MSVGHILSIRAGKESLAPRAILAVQSQDQGSLSAAMRLEPAEEVGPFR